MRAAIVALAIALTPGCSLKKIAINSVADTLAESGDTFASDADPELIRDAVPFSLKLVESLLVEVPKHRGLLLTACSGFAQYAYAFVDQDAELVKLEDYTRYSKLQDRARRMYLRGRDYCLRSLELGYPGITTNLAKDPEQAAATLQKKDVPLIYWTGASWGKVVSLSLDRPALAGDFPIVRALVTRALALDESFNMGAIHEVMVTLESLPEDMGGNRDRARTHYERGVALAKGNAASLHVTYAMAILLPQQKRAEFVTVLNSALEVDIDREPKLRLANVLAQQYAQYLLEHLDELFVSDKETQGAQQN
jgi:predicted anti-sigma-YlaC factor YlaD